MDIKCLSCTYAKIRYTCYLISSSQFYEADPNIVLRLTDEEYESKKGQGFLRFHS